MFDFSTSEREEFLWSDPHPTPWYMEALLGEIDKRKCGWNTNFIYKIKG